MLSAENLGRALRRVRANGAAPGVDGMTTEELVPWLREHWASVRQALDAGTYRPSPVRRVVIPKPGGGERLLGVPTCLDRLIQQAIAQVLTPPTRSYKRPDSAVQTTCPMFRPAMSSSRRPPRRVLITTLGYGGPPVSRRSRGTFRGTTRRIIPVRREPSVR